MVPLFQVLTNGIEAAYRKNDLAKAILKRDVKLLTKCMANPKFDPNAVLHSEVDKAHSGYTLLAYAVYCETTFPAPWCYDCAAGISATLIAAGADVNKAVTGAHEGETPLWIALRHHDYNRVFDVKEMGDVSYEEEADLAGPYRYGHISIMKIGTPGALVGYLLSKGADLKASGNSKIDALNITATDPLQYAQERLQLEISACKGCGEIIGVLAKYYRDTTIVLLPAVRNLLLREACRQYDYKFVTGHIEKYGLENLGYVDKKDAYNASAGVQRLLLYYSAVSYAAPNQSAYFNQFLDVTYPIVNENSATAGLAHKLARVKIILTPRAKFIILHWLSATKTTAEQMPDDLLKHICAKALSMQMQEFYDMPYRLAVAVATELVQEVFHDTKEYLQIRDAEKENTLNISNQNNRPG